MKQVSDADVWRTIHAAKVKLDESTGEIKMGMGGKYTGRKINRLSKKAREEDDRARGTVATNGTNQQNISNMTNEQRKAYFKKKHEERVKESGGEYAALMNEGMELPSWFVDRNFEQSHREMMKSSDFKQKRETEKAVLIEANNDIGKFSFWVPKSVMEKAKAEREKPKRVASKEVQAKVDARLEKARANVAAMGTGYKLKEKVWEKGDNSRTYLTIIKPSSSKYGKATEKDGGYIDNYTGEYFPRYEYKDWNIAGDAKRGEKILNNNNLAFDTQVSARTIDSNGYMHVVMTPISKACVNPYLGREIPGWEELGLKPEQIYYGLRDAGELAKAANTFNGLPVLMDHHQTDAKNPAKEYTVGSTGTDAKFEAPYLKNSLSITDVDAILAIQDGSARELSCAYRFTPDFTGGEYDAGDGNKIAYDFVMRDIAGNHVALVAEGRAGHDVAVADAMPQIKIQKRSDQRMNRRQKMMAFKRRRNGLAQDANLGIEAAEVLSAGFQKALNAIEAQVEGYAPREVGLDIDEGATVDEIIAKFMPGLDDETKATYKGVLLKLKGDTAVDAGEELPAADDDPENPMGAGDNDPDFAEGVKYGEKLEKNPQERLKLDKEHEREGEEKAEDDDLDERMKDPAFREAFEMGVKYGEKREKADPKKIDRDHEREGMERVLGQDSIAKIKKQMAKDMRNSLRSLNTAAAKVRPLVGTINDPMAFDSADEIYAFALRQSGQNPENYPKAAYAGMVDMLLARKPSYDMAADSAFSRRNSLDEQAEKAFARLKDIQ